MFATVLGPLYLVLGLSILLYAKQWQKIMKEWQKNHLALFPLMLVIGIFGTIIINLHNLWEWNVWLLVTLIGWIWALKAVGYFLLPGSVIKWKLGMAQNTGLIYLCGLVGLVIGAALTYYSYPLPF